jgi:hypothetical protein
MSPIPAPADRMLPGTLDVYPDPEAMAIANVTFKEYLGIAWVKFKGLVAQ